jgi:NAD(P)-dependent dehydrogenase (short-subunit alcohol dehydrogenase family)
MSQSKGSILVTGANGYFGSAIAAKIASSAKFSAYHGLYTVRDASKPSANLDSALARAARSASSFPHPHEKVSIDLSRLDSVRAAAADINQKVAAGELPRIRAIVLNAAVEEYEVQTWNEDGLDMSFAANYLGHWLLMLLLLQSMDTKMGRVIWIASWSHK